MQQSPPRRFTRPLTALPFALAVMGMSSCMTLFEPDRSARAPVLEGFGAPATLQASSAQPQARTLFTQGLAQAYAFNPQEAVRAFKAALAADPLCTLCAWGVAWQLGPNINAPERGDLGDARRYIAWAQRHAARATPFEQALVEAMAVRYGAPRDALVDGPPGAEVCGPPRAGRAHPLDAAYAERMRGLADALPEQPDVVSLYAEAEMIATRDDWWNRKTGQPGGRIGELAPRIDRALQTNRDHTGLNHYLIHALDSSQTADRAVAAADRLGALAPASPHLLHMPSHIYVKVGRFADAVRVNQEALAAETALTAQLKAQSTEPVWNWDRHNLHFLWFAALMRGDGELALSTARRVAELAAKGSNPYADYRRALPLLTLARLQRWDDVLREPAPAAAPQGGPGLADALNALALAHTGQTAAAREKAAALQGRLDTAKSKSARATEQDAFIDGLVGVLSGWLQAELALHDGKIDEVRKALARAAELEDEAGGEPPLLGAGSRAALGDALLHARQWREAEAAFRADLRAHPANVYGEQGLAKALAAQRSTAALPRRAASVHG